MDSHFLVSYVKKRFIEVTREVYKEGLKRSFIGIKATETEYID